MCVCVCVCADNPVHFVQSVVMDMVHLPCQHPEQMLAAGPPNFGMGTPSLRVASRVPSVDGAGGQVE